MPSLVFVSSSAAVLTAAALWVSAVVAQNPPPSALINQRSQETLDAARAASPRSSEETFAYF